MGSVLGWLFSLIAYVALMIGAFFGSFMLRQHMAQLEGRRTFAVYLRWLVKDRWIWYSIALASEMFFGFPVGVIVLCFVVAPILTPYVKKKKTKAPDYATEEEMEAEVAKATRDWVTSLGPTAADRAREIESIFAQRAVTIKAGHFQTWTGFSGTEEMNGYIRFFASRSLASMDNREREWLRIAEQLNSAAEGKNVLYRGWRAALVWGDGKGQAEGAQWLGFEARDTNSAIREGIAATGLTVDRTIDAISHHVLALKDDSRVSEPLRAVGSMTAATLTAGTAGFLKPGEIPDTVFAPRGPHAIHLGSLEDGSWLSYSGSGALVTIAAPGSGKSQCHVIPNLLQWHAPAVVLDVKGEIYEATSKWRAANVGPVYRFAPTDPARSHHYNPLAFISRDADQIWQESRFLTDMMIVPSGSKDNQFWDGKAKEVVAAAIASICYSVPPSERSMAMLLNIIHGGKAYDEMLIKLRMAVDVPAMVRAGTSLSEMNEKTRNDVLATVQTSFHGWGDAPVARVTDRCDWSPLDLRTGTPGGHPTIYICLKPREVESYLSILRVFIAQHIRMLTGDAPTETNRDKQLPILFVLDELPRLREMPPVAEAIEIGASYGIRIWMFAQSLGQLQTAYPNADGMIGSCAVRVYMNPSGADGLAERLSDELGFIDSLADGSRKRLVEAADLAGPGWRDLQLVMGSSSRPARIRKNYAYQMPELQSRMGAV